MKWTCFSLVISLMTFWSLCVPGCTGKQCSKNCPGGCSSWCAKFNVKDCNSLCPEFQLKDCNSWCREFNVKDCNSWCPDEKLFQYIIKKNLVSNDTNCLLQYRNCTDCLDVCRKCPEDIYNADVCKALCTGVCSPCELSGDCDQILLFDGGFSGQIRNNCNDSNVTLNCLYNGLSSFNTSNCILSFDATNAKNQTDGTCRFSDSGVWLSYNDSDANNQYVIKISRDSALKPTSPICFVNGSHSCATRNKGLINCTQPKGYTTWQCENMTCVDPNTICNTAEYKNSSVNSANYDFVTLTGSSATCIKYGSAVMQPEGHLNLNFTFNPTSNVNMVNMIKNLNDIVLKEMENKSSMSVSFDDISGIFVKPPLEDVTPVYIMCNDDNAFNIIQDETQMKTFQRTFSVPHEAFEKAATAKNSTLFASVLKFPKFMQDNSNSNVLNNEVYSIDMGEEISNLTNTFNITFRNIDLSSSSPECHSWNGTGKSPNWTTSGCNTSYTTDSVTCQCQHLTFFAVLMSPVTTISDADLKNLTYITSIGCGLSLFFLSIALFMHFLLRKGRSSISVHILISLFLALFLLNLSFLVNESVANTGNEIGCKFSAGMMHYSMLSTFTWFGVQALHLCLQLAQNVSSIQNYVIKLSILGWGPPALVVTAMFILQKYNKLTIVSDTGKNSSMCWITDSLVHYVVNIGYYAIIFLFTSLTFVVMLRWLCLLRTKRPNIAMSNKKSKPSDALTIMGLCCVLGLSWGFAFFAYGPMQIPAFYIFSILNSLQGFFLFIYYYKSSRLVGEDDVSAKESSYTTEVTAVENPYDKHKTS